MQFLNINLLEELKKRIEQIELFTKDTFLEQMKLNDKSYQDIFSDQELEVLCENKKIWIESIDEAIAQQTKKQDSAAIITANGSFIIQVYGEDKQETIESVDEAYKKFTEELPEVNDYKSQEEFLAAAENQNLPKTLNKPCVTLAFQ